MLRREQWESRAGTSGYYGSAFGTDASVGPNNQSKRPRPIDPDMCFIMMISCGGGSYFGRLEFDQKGFCQQVYVLMVGF